MFITLYLLQSVTALKLKEKNANSTDRRTCSIKNRLTHRLGSIAYRENWDDFETEPSNQPTNHQSKNHKSMPLWMYSAADARAPFVKWFKSYEWLFTFFFCCDGSVFCLLLFAWVIVVNELIVSNHIYMFTQFVHCMPFTFIKNQKPV